MGTMNSARKRFGPDYNIRFDAMGVTNMRMTAIQLLLTTALVFVAAAASSENSPLYVSPEGNDQWSGLLEAPTPDGSDGPLATIEGARNALRARPAAADNNARTVILRGGVYPVSAPIVFEPVDSETTYRAYPGETPVLHGGRQITAWQAQEGLWVADVPEAKSSDCEVSALWVNGVRRDPARFPKAAHPAGDYPEETDFFYLDGPVMDVHPDTGAESKSNTRIRFRPGDLKEWDGLDDAVFVMFHSWETSLHRVKQIDLENRVVEFTGPAPWAFTYWRDDQWYFVEHLRAALNEPGDWCLDRGEGKLYYKPLVGQTIASVDAVIPIARHLILLNGRPEEEAPITNLRFEGIALQYTDWPIGPEGHRDSQAAFSVGAAVEAVGALNCAWVDCEIAHTGGYGLWLRAGCQNNRVEGCALYDLGAGGVRIGEGGDPSTPAHAVQDNALRNCLLHDGGRLYRGAVGVWIGRASGNTVAHNEICDFRYTGVSVGWSWGYAPSSANRNVIEYNHIHDIGKGQLSDMGGIYTLGVSPGTVLRGNYIHDVLSNPKVSGGWGVYTDEGSTDILIAHNVVHHTRTGGFHQHYGKENRVVNNIFAFSEREQIIRSREEEHVSFFFENNIVYFNNGSLLGSTWKNGNWKMDGNCYWDASGAEINFAGHALDAWRELGHDKHSVVADPLFKDPRQRDFSLAPNSPVRQLGFEPIDTSLAGIQTDGIARRRAQQAQRTPAPPVPE